MKDSFYDKGLFKRWVKNAPLKIKMYLRLESKLLEERILNNATILEVGCGYGRMMKILSKKTKKIIGLDNNKRMINDAKQYLKGVNNCELYFGNAENMPFNGNSFDYTICVTNTFGDFGIYKNKILNEMKRVTKKNGRIIITVWSESILEERIKAYENIGAKIERVEGQNIILKNSHVSEAFTKQSLKDFFEIGGLKPTIVPIEDVGYLCEL